MNRPLIDHLGAVVFLASNDLGQGQPLVHTLGPHHGVVIDMPHLVSSIQLLDAHHLNVARGNRYHPLIVGSGIGFGSL